LVPTDVVSVIVPFLIQYHGVSDENAVVRSSNVQLGPYFPRRGHKVPPIVPKNSARPIRPIMQMAVNVHLIEVSKVRRSPTKISKDDFVLSVVTLIPPLNLILTI